MKQILLTFAGITMLAHASHAGEVPKLGIVYNTVEANAMTYNCNVEGIELVCKFNQMRVRRLADPKNEKTFIAKARTEYRKNKDGISAKECKNMQKIEAAIKNGNPPEGTDVKAWKKSMGSQAKKKKLLDALRPILAYCDNPSESTYLEIVRSDFLKKTRTCSVSNNAFEQRFKHFASTNTWVVTQEGPLGICGIVNVSKFEPVKVGSSTMWRYVSKKVITNKDGRIILGKCSELDEREYLFDWRSEPRDMGCDVIKFGVF